MNIVVPMQESYFTALINDFRDYKVMPGYHIYVLKRKPLFLKPRDRMYLWYAKNILGYAVVADVRKVDEEEQILYQGMLWTYKNQYVVTWKNTKWYNISIVYDKNFIKRKFRYISLKTALKGKEEPKLIDTEKLCKDNKEKTGKSICRNIQTETARNAMGEDIPGFLVMGKNKSAPALEKTIDLGGSADLHQKP